MTFQEIADKAEDLRNQEMGIPDPSMLNYHAVIRMYRQILSDHSVLIRELASMLTKAEES
jgi:hypothetical protein